MADSVSFETNGRLLTGRKCLKRISRPGFLSNGGTKASFQATGNWPDFKDMLINLVSTGSRTSHRLTRVEGIGSRKQDFKDECCIRDFTSCSVNISNSVRWTKDDSVSSVSGLWESIAPWQLRRLLIFTIFCTKNFPMSSANWALSIVGGRQSADPLFSKRLLPQTASFDLCCFPQWN